MRVFLRKLKGRFIGSGAIPFDHDRTNAVLPLGGNRTSVERGLNSRCTSDYDDDPTVFHWGMFDRANKLSDDQIRNIVDLAEICRFSSHMMEVRGLGNDLTLVTDNIAPGIQRDWLMVENGMQQQAIALVCAALGVGIVFQRQKAEADLLSNDDFVTIKIKLDPMYPSYGGSYWSSSAPANEKPWRRGNLPEPARDGTMSLVDALGKLTIENHLSAREGTEKEIGQLLWAARGRTPHLYKSKPWGMTIPTSEGRQDITSVYVIFPLGLFKYNNWHNGRPTHSLFKIISVEEALYHHLAALFSPWNCFIVLEANDTHPIAFWEVGYQLLNILLQAQSINLSYRAALLDNEQRNLFQKVGLRMPAAVVCLSTNNRLLFQLEHKRGSGS